MKKTQEMRDVIVSPDNKFYKLLKKLEQKKYRDENNIFKAEGEKFLLEDISFNKIILKESKYEYYKEKYRIDEFNNVTILKDNLFDDISDQDSSQGVILLYSSNLKKLTDIQGDVVILDNIQDPGNVGTIIRTLEATAFKNLVLTKGSVDVYNPKTVRATMGGIFKINIIYASQEDILSFLNNNNYKIISTALREDSINYDEIEIDKEKNAYIFGNEGNGVSDYFIENSHIKSIIPIYGDIESLNVGIASAVFLYKMREKHIKQAKIRKEEMKESTNA